MNIGTFIKLTESCSAGCKHCPFATSKQKNHTIDSILAEIKKSSEPLIVLSGGEPLEHPEISTLLKETSLIEDKIFRIATGSHISLANVIDLFPTLQNFTGVSLGTDILFSKRNQNNHEQSFWNNVKLLNQSNVNYSLTITLGSDVEMSEVESILSHSTLAPTFFLVQHRDDEPVNTSFVEQVSSLINQKFPNQVIHYANLD